MVAEDPLGLDVDAPCHGAPGPGEGGPAAVGAASCYPAAMAGRPVTPTPRGRALVAVAAALGALVVVVAHAGACASSSSSAGSAAGCARARLARQWSAARVEAFAGCWAHDELPGVLVLTDLPVVVGGDGADGAYADEPPTFRLTSTTALLPGATQQQWELLSPHEVRLTWAKGFDVVAACLVADDADRATTLVGELRVAGQADPLPRPPRPARWRRVDCPR